MTPNNNDSQASWAEWRQHVLLELERLNNCYDRLDTKISNLNEDMIILKMKSGMWGFAAGSVPVIALILYKLIER